MNTETKNYLLGLATLPAAVMASAAACAVVDWVRVLADPTGNRTGMRVRERCPGCGRKTPWVDVALLMPQDVAVAISRRLHRKTCGQPIAEDPEDD